MNKRIFSIIMVAVMACSVIYIATPEKASAASKKPYMTTSADYTGTPREKVGDYYIWVDYKEENGTHFSSLKCAKSLKKGKVKTLRKVNSKTKRINWNVVTDGKNIYYGVSSVSLTGKGTIYKTTVKGSTHKKVKTVKNLWQVVAFYNGKIYYNTHGSGYEWPIHLCSYDIAKKKIRMEKKNYEVDSAYGRYMVGGEMTSEPSNYMHELYDAKTGKSSSVGEGCEMTISGKTIYYGTVTYTNNGLKYTIKQCDLSGKNKKTIKKAPKNMTMIYAGRKVAYFKDDTGKTKKLTYSTKKFTTVK